MLKKFLILALIFSSIYLFGQQTTKLQTNVLTRTFVEDDISKNTEGITELYTVAYTSANEKAPYIAGNSNYLYALYEFKLGTANRTIRIKVSTNSGQTWSTFKELTGQGYNLSLANAIVYNNKLYVVYELEYSTTDIDLYFYSSDVGLSPSNEFGNYIDYTTQNTYRPAITANAYGIYVGYINATTQKFIIKYSNNGGQSFTDIFTSNNNFSYPSTFLRVDADNGGDVFVFNTKISSYDEVIVVQRTGATSWQEVYVSASSSAENKSSPSIGKYGNNWIVAFQGSNNTIKYFWKPSGSSSPTLYTLTNNAILPSVEIASSGFVACTFVKNQKIYKKTSGVAQIPTWSAEEALYVDNIAPSTDDFQILHNSTSNSGVLFASPYSASDYDIYFAPLSSLQPCVLSQTNNIPNPVPSSGGNYTMNVTLSGTNCNNWTINSNVSWITVNPTSGGNGTTPVSVNVAQNTSTNQRTGTITITSSGASGSPITTNIIQGGTMAAVPLIPVTVSDSVQRGQDFWISVQVGNASNPVTNLKVISFTMHYTGTDIVDYLSYEVGDFITGAQATVLPDDPNGNIDASVYRTSGGNSGHGVIIKFKFNVSNQANQGTQITFSFPSVQANDANGNLINILPQSKTVTIISEAIVWPGDADNNGNVNILDINPVIVNYDSTGPIRPNASNNWIGQLCPFWTPPSLTYVDCNGDGVINIFEINTIIINYGRTHTNRPKLNTPLELLSTDPPISINVTQSLINPGDTIEVVIFIGSATLPVTNVKVVSFEMSYTSTNYLDFLSWQIGTFITGGLATVVPDDPNGLVSASVYRTSGGNTGYGTLIKFYFKVLPNTPIPTTFSFNFGTVQANRSDGSIQPLSPVGTQISIPVEFVSFTATNLGKKVELKWVTATETNNLGFDIERLIPGETNWSKIGFVKGHGTTTEFQNYSFIDNDLTINGEYKYRLKQIDYDGSFEYSNVVTVVVDLKPTGYSLAQNYPNPFNPSTTIEYEIPEDAKVVLKVYDALGNNIAILVNEHQSAGRYNVVFEANNLSNGIYFYELSANNFRQTKKLILMK